MPIPKPELHDRTYDDMMTEILSLIPRYNAGWTNFNPSDLGITILELFAYLTDQTLYRVNRVPQKNYENFLKIIGVTLEEGESIESGIRRGRAFLNERYRAVTAEDYEALTLDKLEEIQGASGGRAIVLNNVDMEYIPPGATEWKILEKSGHISIIVIPDCETSENLNCLPTPEGQIPWPIPTSDLLLEIRNFLKQRRLLATSVHTVAPAYAHMKIKAWIVLKPEEESDNVIREAKDLISRFFHPLYGHEDQKGWRPGRSFFRSELFQLLESTTGVDYVVKTAVVTGGLSIFNPSEVKIKPWEMIAIDNVEIHIMEPLGKGTI